MSRRTVTYSRNVTLSLSRTCVSHCKYCAFQTHQAHLHAPDEVLRLLDRSAARGIKELLILTGDEPGHHDGVRERLAELGHEDFVSYVAWCCERALERGMLPHTNIGAISRSDLARLRAVTASQGLMLESVRDDLVVHQGSPTKDPALRLQTIRDAGALRIPFTSGILVGIGERPEERVAALEALARVHAEHGHLQEVILQNVVPHRRYYGEEPAEIATGAAERFWRTGLREEAAPLAGGLPAWANPVTLEELRELVAVARELFGDEVGIQVPPNLSEFWPELVSAGATDLGGLSANGDHISPEHPFPSPKQVADRLALDGVAVRERLCAYRRFLVPEWQEARVLAVARERHPTFVPAVRGRIAPADGLGAVIERARHGDAPGEADLARLFADDRTEVVSAVRGAADELRAELVGDVVTYVVNRNINVSNVCTVGCSFCGFGQSARSPLAHTDSEDRFRERVREAVEYGATELCIQSGIHPDWDLPDYERWLRVAKEESRAAGRELHLHAYSPMEIAHMAAVSGLPDDEVFTRLADAGLGSTPGTAAELLDDRVRQRISPNKLPAARWVEVIEASHRAGLRSTATVLFGHIERPEELARHMVVVRELQARTGGITEFVPLSFVPYMTRLGRRHGIEPISEAENLRHTAIFRLALGRSVTNLQASWVKMGLDGATEALSWGVNDLGGTLMEESITRMAGGDHGVRLDPEQLIAAVAAAGRPARERTTLYGEIDREFEGATFSRHA
ncbi:MAG: 5-amino-6-(D-ribitylamino)uracil--L-tyrosine 4-hydroxyphenyl transferase CofH [Baekduia sp.]